MGRRELIALTMGAAAWPLAAHAQTKSVPLIAFLNSRSPQNAEAHTTAFLQGLKAFGYVDGQTAKVEYRWANGDRQRMLTLAEELIGLHVAVLVATGGAHLAAKAATASVPIVCALGSDPINFGLAESITAGRQPDRNERRHGRS